LNRLKRLYIVPIILAILAAIILIYIFIPSDLFYRSIFVVGIPLIILGIGFRIITYQRIQIIRNQLYQILQTLEEFDVDEPEKVSFEPSPFPIFNELNEYLIELIDRVRANYTANKQFTQNASHELQTPLAIIKGHIEILLQSPNIGEKEMQSLSVVLQNSNRLSKLNSALILLSKIENQRFSDTETISFTQIIEETLSNFKDLISIQAIEIQKEFIADFKVEMSQMLAEILIANLIQNAIRHNIEEGNIHIKIESNQFQISNTGKNLAINPATLFKRFKRDSEVEESLGLGLSIIKRICEQSNLTISYTIDETAHQLEIRSNRL